MTEMPLAELQAWCAAFTTLPEATANTLCEEYLHACTRAQHDPSQANTVSFRLFKQKALELDAQQTSQRPKTIRGGGYPYFYSSPQDTKPDGITTERRNTHPRTFRE